MIAHYFKTKKPKSKVLLLDANADIVSKKGLFVKAWQDLYPGIIEYRPKQRAARRRCRQPHRHPRIRQGEGRRAQRGAAAETGAVVMQSG